MRIINLKTLRFLQTATLSTLVFLLPTQLAIHLWPEWSKIYGIRIDYLSPTLYLSEILVLVLVVPSLINILLNKRKFIFKLNYAFWIFLVFAGINIIFSLSPPITAIYFVKASLLLAYAVFIKNIKKKDFHRFIFLPLILSLTFFSLIAIGQFLLGRNLGGIFYFLGERPLNTSGFGIALSNLFGSQHLRPYSTFSHPNSLAGFLSATLLFLVAIDRKKIFSLIYLPFWIIVSSALFLSMSKSVFISVGIIAVFFLIYRKKKINNILSLMLPLILIVISLLMILVIRSGMLTQVAILQHQNIIERIDLVNISGNIASNHFLIGVGENNFIIAMSKIFEKGVWLLQPVHNIYLLTFAEGGIIGIFLLFIFLVYILRKSLNFNNRSIFFCLFLILLTGFFDHYWLTITQNKLLITLIIGTLFNKNIFQSKKYAK